MKARHLLPLLTAAVLAEPHAPLGRLFHTPEERRRIEQQQEPAPPEPSVEGVLQGDNGLRLYWSDGEVQMGEAPGPPGPRLGPAQLQIHREAAQ